MFVGRMVPGKGWDTFLEAIAQLKRSGHDVTGELLGDGESLQAAKALVEELGLCGTVEVRGRVEPSSVRDALRGATLVNPTVLSEGFQSTLLEALAEGGRVVTYPVPGAELLREQGAPVLITDDKHADALAAVMERLIAEPPPVVEPSFMEQWTWPTRSRQYLEILRGVTGKD